MRKYMPAGLVAALVISTAGGAAMAHSGATGVVRDRMELMKDIAEQMKHIGVMVKGETAFDAMTVRSAADRVAAHSANMTELFPEGSDDAPSEALPSIWQNWDDFSGLAAELEDKAGALSGAAATATGADDIRAHFASMGRTCAACHEDFRKTD